MSNPLIDMQKPNTIFCIGTNMTECHPVAATGIKKAHAKGAKLIVADPRRIPLAEMADLYLPLNIGTDVALLLGMAHVIVRDGLVNQQFLDDRTRNPEEFMAHLKDYSLDEASKLTGLPIADIEKAAHWYAEADRGAIYYTLGITEHICGVDNVQSLCNLALLTGNLGRRAAGVNPLRGQNNIQGAGDCGALPNNYPGFQPVDRPENRQKFEAAWGVPLDPDQGITKVAAMDQAIEGRIRAMWILVT